MITRDKASAHADQASRLRHLARPRQSSATTLAIMSGKGGVGKSNIAVNLSVYLAAKGLRVALVDLDLGLANADLLMNIQARCTLAQVVSGERTIDDISIKGPCGVRFLPGASGLSGLADLSEFERQSLIAQLHKLEINTDIVVLDCAAGLSRNVVSFALAADRVLVVCQPCRKPRPSFRHLSPACGRGQKIFELFGCGRRLHGA